MLAVPMTGDASNIAKFFGEAVRTLRLAQDLSQEELGTRSGLHRTYVADVERGNRNPSLQSIVRIARGLSVPPSVLMAAMEARVDR